MAPTPTSGSSTGSGFSLGSVGIGTLIVWIILGILILILAAIIIRSAALRRSHGKGQSPTASALDVDSIELNTPPGEIPADEYMHRAMQLANQGDHRRALRQLVLGGMSWIERAGLIRFRKGLTNRDYVRAVYRRAEQRKRFQGIVLNFEKVYFGRRTADEEQFEQCLERYRHAFGEEPNAEALRREAEAAARREEAAHQESLDGIAAAEEFFTPPHSTPSDTGPAYNKDDQYEEPPA